VDDNAVEEIVGVAERINDGNDDVSHVGIEVGKVKMIAVLQCFTSFFHQLSLPNEFDYCKISINCNRCNSKFQSVASLF
jgi:hypothetical protein